MLAVVPVREGVLPAGGIETVDECGGRVLLIGSASAAAATELAGHAVEVTAIEASGYAPAAWAGALLRHLGGEDQIVLPASPDGRDLAPRLAILLQRELFAGAISVAPHRVELARNGGLVINEVRPVTAFVATLQPGVRGADPASSSAEPLVTMLSAVFDPEAADAQVVEVLDPDAATMDLAESQRILGGGAGLQTAEIFAELATLSRALDASMGATRVITDRGWVNHDRQIGTTGVVVDPKLYLAFGISGAVQHTSGLGQPEHIISVNIDPHCPMMQLSDLAIVSDANAVIAELLERIATRPAMASDA